MVEPTAFGAQQGGDSRRRGARDQRVVSKDRARSSLHNVAQLPCQMGLHRMFILGCRGQAARGNNTSLTAERCRLPVGSLRSCPDLVAAPSELSGTSWLDPSSQKTDGASPA